MGGVTILGPVDFLRSRLIWAEAVIFGEILGVGENVRECVKTVAIPGKNKKFVWGVADREARMRSKMRSRYLSVEERQSFRFPEKQSARGDRVDNPRRLPKVEQI